MMGFMEWIEFNKKKERNKNVGSASPTNQQNRTIDHKRETTRDDKTVYTTTVHNITRSEQ